MSDEGAGLPTSWVMSTIGEWCLNLDSKRLPINSDERKNRLHGKADSELYPYFGATGQVGRIDGYLFDGEYVLIGEDGAPFLDPFRPKAYIASGKFWVNNHAHILSAPIHSKFVCYYLNQFRYADHVTGTTRLKLTKGALEQLPISIAPEAEQKRIVAKIEELFSELDKGIENLKLARAQLAVYRQTLLKHAFEGKLTADWRASHAGQHESGEQLLARVRAERDASYSKQFVAWQSLADDDSSQLPSLPDGWIWIPFGNLCFSIRNGISAKPTGETGEKIFRISAVRPMKVDLDDCRYIETDSNEYDGYLLEENDLLFTRYNGSRKFVGVCGRFSGTQRRLFPDKLIRAKIGVKSALPKFLEASFGCGATRAFVESRIRTTAGQAGVSGGDIKAIPVPICSADEQGEIIRILEQSLPHIDSLESEIDTNLQKSEALRQSILKKAFAGELVPQDPNDEPASALLDRIRTERQAGAKLPKAARKARLGRKKA